MPMIRYFTAFLALFMTLAGAVRAQGVPGGPPVPATQPMPTAPHSNDPHPPSSRPAYQGQNPNNAAPAYPGAAHSNDPRYAPTEPRAQPRSGKPGG